MRLDFYYFSYQCPLNGDMLRLLKKYHDRLDIRVHDITGDFALAKEQRMFFPTLTVLDGEKRYYAPLRESFLEQAARGEYPTERPYLPTLSDHVVTERVELLTQKNVSAACGCCGSPTAENCAEKMRFLTSCGQEIYGAVHLDKAGSLLGGAEYLPSRLVPYDIPRDEKTAFLTCSYLSDAEHDYKTAPLRALEAYLRGKYARLLAITDERGVFPNGDLEFFLRNGYHDEGVIFEDKNYCTLHLLEKPL